MSWSAPPTYTVGEVLTASNLNTYLSANLNFLATPPQCRAWRAGAYTDNNTTLTQCPFDTVQFDSASGFTVGTSAHYAVPVDGTYLVVGEWTRTASLSAGNFMQTNLYNGGTRCSLGSYCQWTANGTNICSPVGDLVPCAAGDLIALYYIDGGGGAASVGISSTFIAISKLSN